jgi:cell division initiation protein
MLEEMTSLRERLQQFEELEASIQEALVQAQQVARDLRRNAGKEAELIVREAKEQSHRILADSSGRVERVQESYEVLRKAKQDFSNDFRHLLKSYLAVMDNADVASAKEIEASLRERLDLESVATARQAAETRGLDEAWSLEDESEEHEGEERVEERVFEGHAREERGGEERREATAAGPLAEDEESSVEAQRIETAASPSGGATGASRERGPQPEGEEPEVDPASVESPAGQQSASDEAATVAPESDIVEEVDREEAMPTEENRAADEFFEEGRPQQPSEEPEERRIFRASRFLRRRG